MESYCRPSEPLQSLEGPHIFTFSDWHSIMRCALSCESRVSCVASDASEYCPQCGQVLHQMCQVAWCFPTPFWNHIICLTTTCICQPSLMKVFVSGGYTYDSLALQWVQSSYVYYLEWVLRSSSLHLNLLHAIGMVVTTFVFQQWQHCYTAFQHGCLDHVPTRPAVG